MNEPFSRDTAVAGFDGRRSEIDAIVAAARRHRGEVAGQWIRSFVLGWRLRLTSVFAPMFGWQRHQLSADLMRHRPQRSA